MPVIAFVGKNYKRFLKSSVEEGGFVVTSIDPLTSFTLVAEEERQIERTYDKGEWKRMLSIQQLLTLHYVEKIEDGVLAEARSDKVSLTVEIIDDIVQSFRLIDEARFEFIDFVSQPCM